MDVLSAAVAEARQADGHRDAQATRADPLLSQEPANHSALGDTRAIDDSAYWMAATAALAGDSGSDGVVPGNDDDCVLNIWAAPNTSAGEEPRGPTVT
jgi:hypothetical protein